MGLIGGILLPIYRGVETVIISPTDFVRNPLLWLRCIDFYDGSSNGAPNFGYELCVRRIDHADCEGLDLSSWKVAVAGAEPVRASTLRRFKEKFARYGFASTTFCPAFGMAETTVMATGSRLGEAYKTFHVDAQALQLGKVQIVAKGLRPAKPIEGSIADTAVDRLNGQDAPPFQTSSETRTLELVSSGTPVAGIEYEIVDPHTCLALPDDRVGEIWVRGSSVASGYWNDARASEHTFQGRLAGASDDLVHRTIQTSVNYLRTGDLAARVDGELIVTGRLKELIIVAGRNFYPHDIEQIVQSTSEAFKPDTGTALSVDVDNSEEMLVIQELWRPKKFSADELLQEIVAAIAEQAQVTPHAVVLVRSGSLPKTSSGKLRRTDAKKLFLDGELIEIARWESGTTRTGDLKRFEAPASATEQQIAEVWSRLLDLEGVSREDDFFHLGGESLLIANMLVKVSEIFGTAFPMSALFRNPKLKDFAAVVDSHRGDLQPLPLIHATEAELTDRHRLSSAQQRFWLLDRLGQTNAFVHVPVTIALDRTIEPKRMQAACDRMLARHAMLRARFIQEGENVWQTFSDQSTVAIQSFASDMVDQAVTPAAWHDFVSAPMDLTHTPLMRVALTNTNTGTSRIDFVFHHLICDASSLQILLAEMQRDLAKPDPCVESREAASELRYVDFATWEGAPLQRDLTQERLQYWTQRLAGMPTELDLTLRASQDQTIASAREPATSAPISTLVATSLSEQIEQLARELNMTPSMIYLTAFQSVLARYSGKDDFGITIPTSTRPASGLHGTVGCFVNPIVYRAQIDREQTIVAAMSQLRTALLSDLEHADVPFQDVVAAIGTSRDELRMPLSQAMFLYQPPLSTISHLGDAQVTAVRPDYSAVTAYDFSLIIQPGARTEMTLTAGEQISHHLGKHVFESIMSVLQQLVDYGTGDATLASLKTISDSEQRSIECSEKGNSVVLAPTASVLTRLHQHAADHPSAIAIRDDHRAISYRDLDEQSDRIAAALAAADVRPQSIVAVEMPRSIDVIVTILGVWKAASAYVPIEPNLPLDRRDQIVADAAPALVIDASRFDALMQASPRSVELQNASPPIDGAEVAYLMYTSGSSGKPKGVAVTHDNLSNLLASFAGAPGFSAGDSMLAVTTISFDISVLEMFLPLWCGGHVCMTAHRLSDNPEAVISAIDQLHPSMIQSTPSAFRMLLSANWRPSPGTRVLCGGEPLLPDLAGDLLASHCEVWNVYGPTETTVWSMAKRIESADMITIGRPIGSTTCRVADCRGDIVPMEVVGELHIGGAGVARGYWRDEEQTQERFYTRNGMRFYKTGDRVRRLSNGELEFLARNDRQVKLRGFRIELDEIESALQQCDGVDRAAVVLHDDHVPGSSRMVAFCCGAGNESSVRQQLNRSLSDYMVPATIQWLDSLPQTPAGKTDYKSLPAESTAMSTRTSEPPQTPLEITLAAMWREVLGCETIGRHDHFFDIGGNSLMAAQLFARLRQRFDVQLPLREVYSRPTIAALAEAIIRHQAETAADDVSRLLGQLDALSDDEVIRALDEMTSS